MQKMMNWMMAAILVISGATTVLTSCSKNDDNQTVVTPPAKEYFTLWNQCEALTALQDYVKDVTDPASANFIPANRVIGMDVKLHSTSQGDVEGVNYTMGREEDLVRTDELIIKNLKTNKVLQISQEIGKVPVLSFGNSGGDAAMHNYALGNQKYKS